jgi:hypothetical protein
MHALHRKLKQIPMESITMKYLLADTYLRYTCTRSVVPDVIPPDATHQSEQRASSVDGAARNPRQQDEDKKSTTQLEVRGRLRSWTFVQPLRS